MDIKKMEMKKNDIIDLDITGYTAEGSGVGRYKDIAVFVPLAAAGDKLRVQVLKTAKTFGFGRIDKIVAASKDRVPQDCMQFAQCGGCVYRHISYQAELKAKQQRVQDAMERIGGFHDVALEPIVGAINPNRYRNKAQIPIGRGPGDEIRMGFFASHSHRIIHCD